MADLFKKVPPKRTSYSAKDIEVLEGLEPVRRRPGMYIGGSVSGERLRYTTLSRPTRRWRDTPTASRSRSRATKP